MVEGAVVYGGILGIIFISIVEEAVENQKDAENAEEEKNAAEPLFGVEGADGIAAGRGANGNICACFIFFHFIT